MVRSSGTETREKGKRLRKRDRECMEKLGRTRTGERERGKILYAEWFI